MPGQCQAPIPAVARRAAMMRFVVSGHGWHLHNYRLSPLSIHPGLNKALLCFFHCRRTTSYPHLSMRALYVGYRALFYPSILKPQARVAVLRLTIRSTEVIIACSWLFFSFVQGLFQLYKPQTRLHSFASHLPHSNLGCHLPCTACSPSDFPLHTLAIISGHSRCVFSPPFFIMFDPRLSLPTLHHQTTFFVYFVTTPPTPVCNSDIGIL